MKNIKSSHGCKCEGERQRDFSEHSCSFFTGTEGKIKVSFSPEDGEIVLKEKTASPSTPYLLPLASIYRYIKKNSSKNYMFVPRNIHFKHRKELKSWGWMIAVLKSIRCITSWKIRFLLLCCRYF